MVVYPATAPTYRTPRRSVVIGGEIQRMVLASRVTRGWDQDLATAEVVIPYPPSAFVKHRTLIQISMGVTQPPILRFTGYITSIDTQMWPGRVMLGCEDTLALAKYYRPDTGMSVAGMTDQQAVKAVLDEVQLPYVDALIQGTGKKFGADDSENPALHWDRTTTALAFIQAIDQVSVYDTADNYQGIYRTFADPGGFIRRIPLHPLPSSTAAHTFTEGVDIEAGTGHIEAVEPSKIATAAGNKGLTVTLTGTNPWAVLSNPAYGLFPLLDVVDGNGSQLDLTSMAKYLLQQEIANLLRIDFTTRREDLIGAHETERVISPHMILDIKALIQSVVTEMNEAGGFLQQLSLVSYRELNIDINRVGTVNPIDGGEIPPEAPPDLPPPDVTDLEVAFLITGIDKEVLGDPSNTADTGQAYFIVTAEDASTSLSGTIVSQSWTAAGPGVRITTGSGPTFTTAFTDLAGATITLTVTDSNGSTGSLTLPVDTSSAPVRVRTLFACSATEMYASDGEQWRKQAPAGAASVQCVANGPMWGCGNLIAVSEDFLATPATEIAAFVSGNVSTIWISESNSLFAAAGTDDGKVAVTRDRGATWEPKTSPGSAVKFIIVSIHDTSELHVVTPEGWFKSQDEGGSWEMVRAGDFDYLELSHSRNIVVTSGGQLQKAEDGTPFTRTTETSPVVAATAHIRQDRFYALAADGSTWVQEESGSYAMVAGASIPAGEPYHAGTYRDGLLVDLIYFAAQAGGLFKTIDGFRTSNGYLRILTEGRLTP